ncbi:hypothetical protein HZ326_22434 [Fusarium oxysporum f. sp. albedinis]|nr:hypothetical protein HZ326_22434 [Fusarium oxysporum f. sp. albedinis]
MLHTSTASRQLSASLASHPISQLSRITKILALNKGQSNLRSDILMRIIKPACWDATTLAFVQRGSCDLEAMHTLLFRRHAPSSSSICLRRQRTRLQKSGSTISVDLSHSIGAPGPV